MTEYNPVMVKAFMEAYNLSPDSIDFIDETKAKIPCTLCLPIIKALSCVSPDERVLDWITDQNLNNCISRDRKLCYPRIQLIGKLAGDMTE